MRSDFEVFFRDSFVPITLFLIRSGAGRTEAEDAVQEAMALAYRSWSLIRVPEAWVRVVARRVFLASDVRECGPRDREADFSGWTTAEADDLSLFGDEERRVVSLLRGLPPAQREAMAWFYDGYHPHEIAAIVGKSAATVRSELRFARQRLRANLAADPESRTRWPGQDDHHAVDDRKLPRDGITVEQPPSAGTHGGRA